MIIPLIYSFTFFNRFAGQIEPTDYPKDWYEINNFLNKDKQDFKILFLPWHQYMSFDWVLNKDKSIANPSRYFFDKEVISGTNVEIGNIRRQDYSPDQVYIDFLLKNKYSITNFGKQVSILNVKYILLTKEVDYKKYFFLFNQTDLELIKETKHLYNLEATPAESTSYRFALRDQQYCPGIKLAGSKETPYLTNSTQLPVDYTDDLWEALKRQDDLQTSYTGGTIFHIFLGEEMDNWKQARTLVQKVAESTKMPYFTVTPTFSVCMDHGRLKGKVEKCPKCGKETEVYSRIVGYLRPISRWNKGKDMEFRERKMFKV